MCFSNHSISYIDVTKRSSNHTKTASFGIGGRKQQIRNKIGLNTGPDCTLYNLPTSFSVKNVSYSMSKVGRGSFDKVF